MTDGERIAKVEQKVDDIEKKVDAGFAQVLKRLDALDNKFAAKWVEKALTWFIYLVVGAVIIGLLSLLGLHVGVL